MTVRRIVTCSAAATWLVLGVLVIASPYSPAQSQGITNQREIKSSGASPDDPKSDVWTMDFNFKDPRLIKVHVPGRGTRICWYMWFQIINRTKEPRTIYPEFELVTLDPPATYYDETLTTVEEEIKKIEDPSGYRDIKNTVMISANPIPVSLAAEKAYPTKAVTGIAIWDGAAADTKNATDKVRNIGDSQGFRIFVSGLSNGWVTVNPLDKGRIEQPIIRRKTLQLNFKRTGDRYTLDSKSIVFEPPAEWIYRATRLPKLKSPEPTPPAGGKDGKNQVRFVPFTDLNYQLQPAIHRGNANGT